MALFDRKYETRHRGAIIQAGCDRGIKPARRIVELAAAGQLTYEHDGETVTVEPFAVPLQTVHSFCRDERRRRSGTLPSPLSDLPPRDALEAMRRRLAAVADHEISRLENAAKTRKGADLGDLTKAARLLRELAAIPGPTDPRPAPPGKGPKDTRQGGETRTGTGAAILAAHRGNGTAHDTPPIDIPHTHIGDDDERPAHEPHGGDEGGTAAPRTTTTPRHTTGDAQHHDDTPREEGTRHAGSAAGAEIAARVVVAARGVERA